MPYEQAAHDLRRKGWHPIPLPAGQKFPPPTGYTGYDALPVSGADVQAWIDDGRAGGNVALRTPGDVLGLDLDHYDGKPGLQTMRDAVGRLGPLPPSPTSTSRADDPVSGIRFYRVPPGRRWADGLGPGVEVIHHGHRYALVSPSVHPEGRVYRWHAPNGDLTEAPAVDDLPQLPPTWAAHLDCGDVADRPAKADLTSGETRAWLQKLPGGPPCRYVSRLLDELDEQIRGAASRHDLTRNYIAKIVRAGDQGHRGIPEALRTAESLLERERPLTDPVEVARMVAGAVSMCVKEPCSVFDKGCCPSESAAEDDPADGLASQRDVNDELRRLRVRKAAQDALRAESEPDAPAFDSGTLRQVMARPADPPMRVERLIPSDAAALLAAQRKTGKTTLSLNLARCLLTGEDFLDTFGVRHLAGSVAFLNYEVSAAQLARWAHDCGVPDDRLLLVNLRGRRNPLAHPDDRARLAALLRTHDVEAVIVDPFGRAYAGASQNDAGEVGAWLVNLDRFVRSEVGATDLILNAHAGWNGERTRGSSALEDWADVVVTLTRDADDESQRFLRAVGRDVDLDEDRLDYDPQTRMLRLTGTGSRRAAKDNRKLSELAVLVVRAVTATPGASTAGITKAIRGMDDAPTFQDRDVSKAAALAAANGHLRIEDHGAGRPKNHYPADPVQPRPDPVHGQGPKPRPTPSIGGRGLAGGSEEPSPLDGVAPANAVTRAVAEPAAPRIVWATVEGRLRRVDLDDNGKVLDEEEP